MDGDPIETRYDREIYWWIKPKQEWDKLMTTNYSLWKSMMEDLLNCKYPYDPIKGDKANPSEMLNLD